MKRRSFVATTSIGTAAIAVGCKPGSQANFIKGFDVQAPYTLPELPYAADALVPAIDEKTMLTHHGKHHAGYVRKLNKALENKDVSEGTGLSTLLATLTSAEGDAGIVNNGGGHYNHSLFWTVLSPSKNVAIPDPLSAALKDKFGSVDEFHNLFGSAAASVFGSGWAWLIVDDNKKLQITTTQNQENPLMKNIVENPGSPIMGIDVWEHAYYLNYQNRRKDYINAFGQHINWDQVNQYYKSLIS